MEGHSLPPHIPFPAPLAYISQSPHTPDTLLFRLTAAGALTLTFNIPPKVNQRFSGPQSTYSPNFMKIHPQPFEFPSSKQTDKQTYRLTMIKTKN